MRPDSLDEENAHVQQLKKLFLECDLHNNGRLTRDGLFLLCEKLNLADFSEEITLRSLVGSDEVDFNNFKDRFVALLPEIIDVSSGSVDSLLSRAIQTSRRLGYGDGQRLSRYEARVICEKTAELAELSVYEINSLYERSDANRTGRVSIQQFLNQYRHQKRLSAEVHYIEDSYESTLNLFEALDPAHSGQINSQDLLESWSKAHLRIDEGIAVLQQCGQPVSGMVNAIYLSAFLESELNVTKTEAPVAVKTAIIALQCCVNTLRLNLKELEERAEHSHKQLQMANQRRTMLIEELEHNQMAIEQSYEQRMREMDEKFRSKMSQLDEKLQSEKRDLQNDLEQVEDELTRVRQSETSARNKVTLLERQCARLNDEAREATDNISQLEQLNRQLRSELNKAVQSRPTANIDADPNNVLLWKQKVELLVNHNKRLREKLQDMTASESKRRRRDEEANAIGASWSPAFKSQVSIIRKRRSNKGETLSEMDSEPEGIFFRVRRRRLQKKRERRKRYDQLQQRLAVHNVQQNGAESSDSESTSSQKYRLSSSSILSKGGNLRKRSTHSPSPMQTTPTGFSVFINHAVEEERKKWQEEMRKEAVRMKAESAQTVEGALKEQERKMKIEFDNERSIYDSRIIEVRNNMERSFAEEKMKMMNRLQEDFDQELRRVTTSARAEKSSATVEHYKRQIKMLESSIEGQRNGYEKKLADMKDRHNSAVKQLRDSNPLERSNTGSFMSLIEKYRRNETSAGYSSSPSSSLAVEKQRPQQTLSNSYHNHAPFQRSVSSLASRCERCEQVDSRLRELYNILCGDQTSAESGIEDLGSSTGSHIDDKLVLKKELRKWKGRFEAAKERVTELRILVNSSGVPARYKNSLGGSEGSSEWKKMPLKWSEMARAVDRLESEKVILESRLAESQMMMKKVLEEFKKQHEYFTSVRSNSSQSLPPPPSSLDESSLKELHSAR
ncbi:hypothetical protein PRIPAC_96617 [Pristionchus pacificus]|uniref:Uncharacterized protein n=1 Tax=Pristionchus pacificus TaxID=54126 RepID=A0A2A6D0P3_PRIPA|nr:hypothetical protein PRIPAC_96617 [Pristionchus pacificus]|eukprot:PDM83940.1 hypothetical protein PRIPAC_34132 [Pristionchus pacificus]